VKDGTRMSQLYKNALWNVTNVYVPFSLPPYHRGMTLEEVAKVSVDQAGARYAINLDGGSSSTMVVDGKLVNRPMCLDVLPVKCQRPVATVMCVDTPADKETESGAPDNTFVDDDKDALLAMHTRTTRRKGTVP
jgi:hypothetical protein